MRSQILSSLCHSSVPSVLIVILGALSWTPTLHAQPTVQIQTQATNVLNIPLQTDDGLDPITLVFVGYAPAWWVVANIVSWSDSAYCSGAKSLNGADYNYTLEHPDPNGIPCYGPRDHFRIWDMGTNPVYGHWSVGSAHHEHTVCFPCHHVIDSWEKAEADVRSSLASGLATASISNLTLANAGYYQDIYNDGNATVVRFKPPPSGYPVVFNEVGLGNGTSWSVTMNSTSQSSAGPDITFSEANGTYFFSVNSQGYTANPSTGSIILAGDGSTQKIFFGIPWTTSFATVYSTDGKPVVIGFSGNTTVSTSSVRLTSSPETSFSFTATELGSNGALNVTIPKSSVPSNSKALVYLDGTRDDYVITTEESTNYHVYFLLAYGTHSVELRFAVQPGLNVVYIVGGVLAAGFLAVLLTFAYVKKRRPSQNKVSRGL